MKRYRITMRLEFRGCIVEVVAENEKDALKKADGGDFELIQEGECSNWLVESDPEENK